MGKYDSYNRKRKASIRQGPHPIWRGIGCLMLVIVPAIAFGFAAITMDTALRLKWPLPSQFLGNARFSDILYKSQVLVPILNAIASIDNLYGYLAFTLLYIVILGAIMSFVYALVYRLVGPPTYSPLDMPPIRGQKVKRYKR